MIELDSGAIEGLPEDDIIVLRAFGLDDLELSEICGDATAVRQPQRRQERCK